MKMMIAGLCTGALVGLLTVSITRIGYAPYSVMYWWWSAVLTLVSIVFLSSYIVRFLSFKLDFCQPSLRQLIPIASLTLLIPVLGPVFGGSGDWLEIPKVAGLGAMGGLLWSFPFALSIYLVEGKPGLSRIWANCFAVLLVILMLGIVSIGPALFEILPRGDQGYDAEEASSFILKQ
tara:strand:- start:74 stop:604 length:531 start_codon:yes stop_codon:yes gene_type:complete